MAKYGIWLSYNNQQEGFELPILPAEIEVGGKGDGAGHDVYGLGKINVIKSRELDEYAIESFFPAQRYPFITASIVLEPKAYIDYIQKWRETKRPIRFVYVGATIEVNTAASIEDFKWKEVAGESGDIQFSLRLKEYRFYAARRVQVVQQQSGAPPTLQKSVPKRPNDRQPPQTYTIVAGDNLWKVSKKFFGTPDRSREIQKLNGLTDAQVKRLQVGQVIKLPPEKGTVYA